MSLIPGFGRVSPDDYLYITLQKMPDVTLAGYFHSVSSVENYLVLSSAKSERLIRVRLLDIVFIESETRDRTLEDESEEDVVEEFDLDEFEDDDDEEEEEEDDIYDEDCRFLFPSKKFDQQTYMGLIADFLDPI